MSKYSRWNEYTFLEFVIPVLFVLLVLIGLLQPAFEAAAYNRVTGANVTYWDAVWLDLRVLAEPIQRAEKSR